MIVPEQTPEQIVTALESYLAEYPAAVVTEDGKVLFDMREAKYTVAAEHGRCTLHLWGTDRNLVRRVSSATLRGKALRLATHKFGQTKPQTLELLGDKDRRTPSTREATRTRFGKVLERVLERHFEGWHAGSFRTAMDLEKSFGPAYARGLLLRGNQAWAVIGVNDEESPATVDGILTFGLLWLHQVRESGDGRRLLQGLKVIVPAGGAALTRSRMAWLAGERSRWELLELDQRSEELAPLEPVDSGNLATRLLHAPDPLKARNRFAEASARVLALVPVAFHTVVEARLRTATELAFLLHGLEFARIRLGASAESFNRVEEITFGAGPAETMLSADTENALRELVLRLCERRAATGDKRDPLYRMQPERWLEGELRRDLTQLDQDLDPTQAYTQVPAFAAGHSGAARSSPGHGVHHGMDRGMLDLLAITQAGRLAVIEVKADEDPQLALQGLDYWIRVRWHHSQTPDPVSGLGEFQRHGYFPATRLSAEPPRLILTAPALRIHPATETILRYFSPRVDWSLLALDERWRQKIKVVWRKHSND